MGVMDVSPGEGSDDEGKDEALGARIRRCIRAARGGA